ncbi:MAG TPA: hypothetical protein VGG75_05585 [Trebonia sp.]
MSRDQDDFAEFFTASWDPCLRAVAASTGSMTLAEEQTAGAASVAVISALTLGLTGAFGDTAATSGGGTTIREAAFTLTAHSNGTDTLTLNKDQVFNPAALQRALADQGVPALVETETPGLNTTACRFLPEQDLAKVVSATAAPDHSLSTMTINPAAIPAGTELFFGYVNNLHFDHRDNVRGLGSALVEKGCSVTSGN